MTEKELTEQEYNQYKQRMKRLEDYLDDLQNKHQSILEAINAVKEAKGIKGKQKILVPLVTGIYVEATLTEKNTFTVNTGQGTMVDKKPEEIVTILEERLEDTEESMQKVHEKLLSLYDEIQDI